MADRTVTVRLRLDSTQWAAGSRAAVSDTTRLASSAQSAATAAERAAQRTAASMSGTFAAAARQGEAAQRSIRTSAAAATASVERAGQSAVRTAEAASAAARGTSSAAVAAARITEEAARQGALATASVAAAAGEIPPAFRAASTAAVDAFGRIDVAASSAARASLTAASASVSATTALTASTVSVAARAATQTGGLFATTAAGARRMGYAISDSAGRTEPALKGARTASVLLVAAFGAAVYGASKFDSAMSEVRAATQAGGHELDQLRQAALAAGRSTQFGATQAAQAETELAKAGVSTADILGGALRGTLALAAAGQMDVADSAVVAAKAMNSFGLRGSQVAHIADVIAAAAGKSATDVHEMSLAMAQSDLLAHQTGLSLEQTAGALALFAQNGLVGSDAGTSLKTMLMRLTPQSAEARAEMEKLGFSAYDSSGQFIGWSATAQNLQDSLRNLTPQARNAALGVIFGSDAIRAATIVSQAGAKGVDQWTKATNDQGYAARYAATMSNNLAGDLTRLKAALETAFITGGSGSTAVLRDMAKALTEVVRLYAMLPAPVQSFGVLLAGLVGVVGLLGTTFLLAVPKIVAFQTATAELAATMPVLAGAAETTMSFLTGPWGIALGVGIAALTAFGLASRHTSSDVGQVTTAIQQDSGAIGEHTRQLAASALASSGAFAAARKYGVSQRLVEQAALGSASALAAVNAQLAKNGGTFQQAPARNMRSMTDATTRYTPQAQKLIDALNGTNTSVRKAVQSYKDQQAALGNAKKGSKEYGDQTQDTTGDIDGQVTAVQKLTDALDALDGNNINAAQAAIQFRSSMADLKATVKENGHSLDITTTAGQRVKGAFLDAADAALRSAEAVAQQTNSQDAGNRVLAQNITALKQQMLAMGFQKSTVEQLLKTYARVPKSLDTKVSLTGTRTADNQLDTIHRKLLALQDRKVRVTIEQRVQSGSMSSQGGKNAIDTSARGNIFRRYAAGGMEKHVAQIAPAGAWRLWAEPETGGEAYIPLAPGKRARSRAIAEDTVRLLGGRGIAWAGGGIARYAVGGFTYSPADPTTTLGVDAGMDRYTAGVARVNAAGKALAAALAEAAKKAQAVRDAERHLARVRSGHHTAAQLAAAEERLTKARQASTAAAKRVTADRKALNAADAALGVKAGTKSVTGFNLAAYEKQLAAANRANAAWEKNLAKIGARAGQDVENTLRGMGSDGTALVTALAKASGKTFTQIVNQLKALAPTAQATLKDYTAQLNSANKGSATFQQNLLKLAAMGDTALASQLAAQGDDAAAAIAAAAVTSGSAASAANTAAATNAGLLTSDDLANAVALLGVLRAHPGAGIADVLAGTGLDWATVRALAPKIAAQIKGVSGSGTFVAQMAGQGVAMARGGILTRPTTVLAAEAGKTESWIPWDGTARSAALLSATAAAMGYQLVPAGRYAGGGGGGGTTVHHTENRHEWHLHGAHQSLAEQRADLARTMNFVG